MTYRITQDQHIKTIQYTSHFYTIKNLQTSECLYITQGEDEWDKLSGTSKEDGKL